MARGKTTTFELLSGYLEPPDELPEREDGESHRDYLERTHTLHTTCTVRELDHNIDRDLVNRDVDAVELLSRHLVQVGTITDPRKLKTEVAPNMTKGDYDYALTHARIMSLTEVYEYRDACPDCKTEGDFEYDLNEAEVEEAEDPYARILEYTTEDGIELVFRPLYAYDVECLGDIVEGQDDEIRQLLGLRFVSIDGDTTQKTLSRRGRLGKDANKKPSPMQHTKEAVRLLDKAQIIHREREDIRRRLNKLTGRQNLITTNRCKGCRRSWKKRIAIEPSFFMASSGV